MEPIKDTQVMNIFSTKGQKIIYKGFGGYKHQLELANKYLEIGKIYTLSHTDMSNYHTDIYLEEFPDIQFNSVLFKNLNKYKTITQTFEGWMNIYPKKILHYKRIIYITKEMADEEADNLGVIPEECVKVSVSYEVEVEIEE